MFGRKKKAQAARAAEERQLFLKKLGETVDAANRIEDAGERLYKLEELREGIQDLVDGKAMDIENLTSKKVSRVLLGSNFVQIPTLFGISIATGTLPIFLLSFPVLVGTLFMADKSGQNTKKRLQAENADFLKSLKGLEDRVSLLADKVLNENLDAIAKSAKRDIIFDKFPDVKSRFGIAAAKKMARPSEPHNDSPSFDS